MKYNILGYLIGEGFSNVFKNKKSTGASLMIMCATMIIFGVFLILSENINHFVQEIEDAQGIQVFATDEATDEQIQQLGEEINQIEGVNTTEYVSKEEERLLKASSEEDIKTLHPSLRDGLDRPRFAFRTVGKDWIARLDVMKNGKHRLALYKRGSDLSGKPDFVAEEWNSEIEGSAANERIYFYNDTLSVSLSISSDSKYCTLEVTERYEQKSWRTLLQEQAASR